MAELEDGTTLTFNGYRDDGSQVRTEFEGRLWQVTDEEFCAYLYNQWQASGTEEAVSELSPLEEYADALANTVELEDGQLFFTLPEKVPEGAQLTIQISGRAEYGDGFSQSLHFLEDADWTPGERYSIPYDEAYTDLGMYLYADYPDGTQEEQFISLLRLCHNDRIDQTTRNDGITRTGRCIYQPVHLYNHFSTIRLDCLTDR